jgi:AraC-like DNA-binding protein
MKQTSLESFRRNPIGCWAATACSLGWCFDAQLAGVVSWGRPGLQDMRESLRLLEAIGSPQLSSSSMVLVLDARRREVELEALAELTRWVSAHRELLKQRVQLQVGIVGGGVSALLLCGVLPLVGGTHRFEVTVDARAAYLRASPAHGAAVLEEVEPLVEQLRRQAPVVLRCRELLKESTAQIPMALAARELGLSQRSLQRELASAGTSFRELVAECRFDCAHELLALSDGKISTVADRLGVSLSALTTLIRQRSGVTAAELRRRARRRFA